MIANWLHCMVKFRGRERDARSDLQRSKMISNALTDAISSLDAEMAGLGRRIEGLRGWVGGLLGSEDCSSSCREAPLETELRNAELQLMSGLKRLAHLKEVRTIYHGMREAVEAQRDPLSDACVPAH